MATWIYFDGNVVLFRQWCALARWIEGERERGRYGREDNRGQEVDGLNLCGKMEKGQKGGLGSSRVCVCVNEGFGGEEIIIKNNNKKIKIKA